MRVCRAAAALHARADVVASPMGALANALACPPHAAPPCGKRRDVCALDGIIAALVTLVRQGAGALPVARRWREEARRESGQAQCLRHRQHKSTRS